MPWKNCLFKNFLQWCSFHHATPLENFDLVFLPCLPTPQRNWCLSRIGSVAKILIAKGELSWFPKRMTSLLLPTCWRIRESLSRKWSKLLIRNQKNWPLFFLNYLPIVRSPSPASYTIRVRYWWKVSQSISKKKFAYVSQATAVFWNILAN